MSKAPKVLGTLSIVFGSLVAAWSPLSLLTKSLMNGMQGMVKNLPVQPGMRDPNLDFGAAVAIMQAQAGYMRFLALVMTLMSIALIVVGVGLVKRRAWGRQGAIAWSVLALVLVAVQCTAYFTWLRPMFAQVRDSYYQAHNASPPPNLSAGMRDASAAFGWLLYASFPLVLLSLLGRRSAAEDFTA